MQILSVEDIERNIQQQSKAVHTSPSAIGSRSQTPLNISLQPNQRQPSPINTNNSASKRPVDVNNKNGMTSPNVNGVPTNKLPSRMPPGFPALPSMMGGPGHAPMANLPMHPGNNMPIPGGGGMPRPHPMTPQHFPVRIDPEIC